MEGAAAGAATGAAAGTAISPGLGTLLGAGLGLVGSLFSSSSASRESKRALKYNKWVQQETWKREDNAVQRRASDLKAAGFSPLLAAGSAASTTAPQQVGAAAVPDLSGIGDPLIKSAQVEMALRQQDANIAQTNAQIALADAQRRGVDKSNALTELTLQWYRDHPNYAPGVESSITTGKGFSSVYDALDSGVIGRVGNWLGEGWGNILSKVTRQHANVTPESKKWYFDNLKNKKGGK